MAVLRVAGVSSTCGAPKKLGSSPDVTHAHRELLTSANIVANKQNMRNEKVILPWNQHILHKVTQKMRKTAIQYH